MRDQFVPPAPAPAPNPPCVLLLAQHTRLRCSGVVLGLALHHSVVDARSTAHFVETWASISRGAGTGDAAPVPPCFDHRLLGARPTRTVLYDHPEYKPKPAAPVHAVTASTYVSAIITLSRQQVSALKERCAGASTFRAVVALMYYSGLVYVMNAPGKDGAIALALSLEPESMLEFKKLFADELARLEV